MLAFLFSSSLSNRVFYLQIAADSYALYNKILSMGKYLFIFNKMKKKTNLTVFHYLIDESWHIYIFSRFFSIIYSTTWHSGMHLLQ